MKEKKVDRFYVYALLDPRKPGKYKYGEYEFEYEPFYVGKGSGMRIKAHVRNCDLKIHNRKTAKINKLKKMNLLPVGLIVRSSLLEIDALKFEEETIGTIGRLDYNSGPLTNGTDGGEGHLGVSDITRNKIRAIHLGRKQSEEARRKISESRKGIKFSTQHKYNLSVARQKRITTLETCRKMSITSSGHINIKLFKVKSPEGEEFITHHGLSLFCRENNLNCKNLHHVANGKRRHSKGWTAEYFNDQRPI